MESEKNRRGRWWLITGTKNLDGHAKNSPQKLESVVSVGWWCCCQKILLLTRKELSLALCCLPSTYVAAKELEWESSSPMHTVIFHFPTQKEIITEKDWSHTCQWIMHASSVFFVVASKGHKKREKLDAEDFLRRASSANPFWFGTMPK